MAIVLDALKFVRDKKRLPIEAFFVDTNILIGFIDPFSQSLTNPSLATLNEELREAIGSLKSQGIKAFSTASVALEYYKFIQTGFYKIETGWDRLDTEDFKKLREENIDFILRWDTQLKVFKKNFSKTFPLIEATLPVEELISTFEGSKVDFGDHLLFTLAMSRGANSRCIFTNDRDFCTYPDDLYLLTTNPTILKSR